MKLRQENYPTAPLHSEGPWAIDIVGGFIGFYLDNLDEDAVVIIQDRGAKVENIGASTIVATPMDDGDFRTSDSDFEFKLLVSVYGSKLVQGETLTDETIANRKMENSVEDEDEDEANSTESIGHLYEDVTEDEPPFGSMGCSDGLSQSGTAKLEKLKELINFAIKSTMIPPEPEPEESDNPLDHWQDKFGGGGEGADGFVYDGELTHGQAYFFMRTELFGNGYLVADISSGLNEDLINLFK